MKIQKTNKGILSRGFSLVEMLVVIAVIGIIAAIAVPNIGKINDSAKLAKDQRNAQSLASMFASADAAGYDFSSTASVDAALTTLVTGATIPTTDEGPFAGRTFQVPGLSDADKTGAKVYLNWDGTEKTLSYKKN